MAQTSTLTIKLNETPLVGAEVISNTSQVIEITDENGQISSSLPDDFAACVLVAVRHSSIPGTTYTSICVLESGEDYEVTIPSNTGGEGAGALCGIHADFVEKI